MITMLNYIQRRVARILLRAPAKHFGLALFGFASFVLGANLVGVPYGEFLLLGCWIVATGILIFTWKD